jgi:hypothetical protein
MTKAGADTLNNGTTQISGEFAAITADTADTSITTSIDISIISPINC